MAVWVYVSLGSVKILPFVSLFEVCTVRRRHSEPSRVVAAFPTCYTVVVSRVTCNLVYISLVAFLLTSFMTLQSCHCLHNICSISTNGFGNGSTKVSHNVVFEAPSA